MANVRDGEMHNRGSSEIQGTARSCWGYSEHVGKMTDTRKQKKKKKEKKKEKKLRNADQTLTVRGERADRIAGSPSW